LKATVKNLAKGELPMQNQKVYLLAELTVLPEFLDDLKAILKEVLIPTLQEPGCEALFTTAQEGSPHDHERRSKSHASWLFMLVHQGS
jgi:hypothetical protein